MITQKRQQWILERLAADGQLLAKPTAVELGVSEDTIRRDLRELAKGGHLQRVHGGALPASPAVADFPARQNISTEQKHRIAKRAAELIKPGQVVILDGGTTAVALARALPQQLQATIVTHSPSIAVELANHPKVEVYLIGGKLFKHSVVTMGAAALEALSHIRADLYFMGVTGIHPETGLTTGDLEEAYMKKALSEHAAETIVMASAEKLGVASPYLVVPLTEVGTLIADTPLPATLLAALKSAKVDVVHTV